MNNNVTPLPGQNRIPVALRDGIQLQQRRVWWLRSLLECVAIAAQHGCNTEVSDMEAALNGLTDYADSIHSVLDPEALIRSSPLSQRPSENTLAIVGAFAAFTDGATADRPPIDDLPPAIACPFCGSDEDIFILQTGTDNEPHYRASCGICGVDAPGGKSMIDAADGWNTRGKPFRPGSGSHE